MLANSSEPRGRHRVTNMNPEAALEADGWGNSMIEAYTGNHAGHRAPRKCLKGDTAPEECHVEGEPITLWRIQNLKTRHGKCPRCHRGRTKTVACVKRSEQTTVPRGMAP